MENTTERKTDCTPIHPEVIDRVSPKMPPSRMLLRLSDFFKIMGDPTRIRLLWALEESEMCVCDLAVLLDMTKSAVSHQLRGLKTAKLVRSRKQGKHVYYSLDDDHIRSVLEKALEHVEE